MAEVGEAHRDLMGHMMVLAPKLVAAQGVSDGFRQVINTGRNGGQEVFHLHMHVLAGPRPWAKG
jgi:histidine triad (HIT) family protein